MTYSPQNLKMLGFYTYNQREREKKTVHSMTNVRAEQRSLSSPQREIACFQYLCSMTQVTLKHHQTI